MKCRHKCFVTGWYDCCGVCKFREKCGELVCTTVAENMDHEEFEDRRSED